MGHRIDTTVCLVAAVSSPHSLPQTDKEILFSDCQIQGEKYRMIESGYIIVAVRKGVHQSSFRLHFFLRWKSYDLDFLLGFTG